jgi:aspartokinase-like uncharacterized kinase
MWVVKLGGSLADSETLPHWLSALSQTAAVIVPGGGPFADEVRKAQARWGFDDQTAHDMAILAMRQYGLMLAGLGGLRTATSLDELAAGIRQGQATVWLPLPENLNAAGIPASWDTTSDSLAAWLAGQLSAAHLLLVKSVALYEPEATHKQLIDEGIIDPAFSNFHRRSSSENWLCCAHDHLGLAHAFRSPSKYFIHITDRPRRL